MACDDVSLQYPHVDILDAIVHTTYGDHSKSFIESTFVVVAASWVTFTLHETYRARHTLRPALSFPYVASAVRRLLEELVAKYLRVASSGQKGKFSRGEGDDRVFNISLAECSLRNNNESPVIMSSPSVRI